jgi:hypothetical protein
MMDLPDLTWLVSRLDGRPGVDPHRCVAELRAYFARCATGDTAPPSRDADLAWHEFLLLTREYEEFCQRAFHRFLHHPPHDREPGTLIATGDCFIDPSITERSRRPPPLVASGDSWNEAALVGRLERGGRIPVARVGQVVSDLRLYLRAAANGAPQDHPSPWLDEAWHEWILDTEDYRAFCTSAFGDIIHHQPH